MSDDSDDDSPSPPDNRGTDDVLDADSGESGGISLGAVGTSSEKKFSWPFAVTSTINGKLGSYTAHPFLNEANTADLIFCQALMVHQPWKQRHGKKRSAQEDVLEACRTTQDIHGKYPLQNLKQWSTAAARLKNYDLVKDTIEDKTGPSSGDPETDKLLEDDDGEEETDRVVVQLWRALKNVQDMRRQAADEAKYQKAQEADKAVASQAQATYLRDSAVGKLATAKNRAVQKNTGASSRHVHFPSLGAVAGPSSTAVITPALKTPQSATARNPDPDSLLGTLELINENETTMASATKPKRVSMKRKDDDDHAASDAMKLIAEHAKKKEELLQQKLANKKLKEERRLKDADNRTAELKLKQEEHNLRKEENKTQSELAKAQLLAQQQMFQFMMQQQQHPPPPH